jgi:hypothetical protein
MPLENSIPSGMSTLPTTVRTTVSKTGGRSFQPNTRGTKVRVTGVNEKDGSILYEPLDKNIGPSALGNPTTNYVAYIGNNVNTSIPYVGEVVEIFSAPDISLAESKNQATFKTYYQPSPINIWQNQNNNVVLDSSVQGQAPETPMGNISLENYQRALNGFA